MFYRTGVADFVFRELQAPWNVVPNATQYEAWVARYCGPDIGVWRHPLWSASTVLRTSADALYKHFPIAAERRFWRYLQTGARTKRSASHRLHSTAGARGRTASLSEAEHALAR